MDLTDLLPKTDEDRREKNRARRKREPQSKRTRRNLLKARRRAKYSVDEWK